MAGGPARADQGAGGRRRGAAGARQEDLEAGVGAPSARLSLSLSLARVSFVEVSHLSLKGDYGFL